MNYDGSLREKPIGFLARRALGRHQDDFLRRYIDLIMNSKIVGNTTKIYFRSVLPSVASVIKNHNLGLPEHEQINIKTAQSQINYDRKKLLKYFTEDMLTKVIGYKDCDVTQYNKMLNLAIFDYNKGNKLLDNILLTLPKVIVEDSISDDEWKDFIEIIAPFVKTHREYVESNLPEKSVGYLYYLMSTPTLYGKRKEHYKEIKEMLE